eukprot:scaffold94221_cov26-Prasinocladus_malaysianus.AAC.1
MHLLSRRPRQRLRILHPVVHWIRAHQHASHPGKIQPVRAGQEPGRPAPEARPLGRQGVCIWELRRLEY